MTKLEKFMFDTEFEVDDADWDKEEAEEPVDPNTLPHYSEYDMQAALEKARQESYAEGHATGLAEARNEVEAFAAKELVAVAQKLERLAKAEEANTDQARREAAELALAVGRRLAGALIELHPVAFAEEMIAETLAHMTEALRDSKVVIRVSPDLAEPLTAHIAAVTAKVAFTGQAIVIGDDTLKTGDCRVEWANGGAERLHEDTERWVEDAVARYLVALQEPALHPAVEADEPAAAPQDADAEEPAEAADGVKSVGGSKSVRYDDPAEAEQPAPGVKSVGGSKSVRYDDAGAETTETPAVESADKPADDTVKTVGGSKSVRYD